MNPFFTDPAQASLDRAAAAAAQREQRTVEPRHILLGLLDVSSGPLPDLLRRVDVGREALREAVTRSLPRTRRDEPPSSPPELPYTRRAEAVLESARYEAERNDRSRVGATDLFVALATEKGITRTLLEEFGLDESRVRRAVDAATGEGEGAESGARAAGESPAETATTGEPCREEPSTGKPPTKEPPTGEPPPETAATGGPEGEKAGAEEARGEETGVAPEPETEGPPPADSTPAFRSSFDGSAPAEADLEDGTPDEAAEEPDDGGRRSGPLAAFRDTLGSILSPDRRSERPGPAKEIEGTAPDREPEWEPRPSSPREEPAPEPEPTPDEADPVDLLRVDDGSDAPIYEQIIRGLEEAVATGKLKTGERLPSIRKLADALSVSPGTTARAYRELERRDVVVTRGRRGTYIAPRDEGAPTREERIRALADELRPAVVEAYHMGARADELETALREAMKGILE